MLRRLRLEQKGHFERLVIANRLAGMLECFISGTRAATELGSEQGGIECWDDFVILHQEGVREHVQLKRQIVDFSNAAPVRPSNNPNLSEIDKAFASLADWSRPSNHRSLDGRAFVLELPSLGILIKRDLRVSHLEELCRYCRLEGARPDEFAARDDGPTGRAYEWLKTWCGFEDWSHILAALSRVTVKSCGTDADLTQRTKEILARHFSNPERALEALLEYIRREGADVASITCRPLMQHLLDWARPELITWTQYWLGEGQRWRVSGTHGIRSDEIERPSEVVEKLWQACGAQRRLRIVALCPQQDQAPPSLPAALVRLALHMQGAKQGLLREEPAWRTRASQEVGHTLGLGDSDLATLTWLDEESCLDFGQHRDLSLAESRTEADELGVAMNERVWGQVKDVIPQRLNRVRDAPLLEAMDSLWGTWRAELDASPSERVELFAQMLYPAGEGCNVEQAYRVGPRTVELIAYAFETLLLVAAAIGGPGANWRHFPTCGAVNTVALRRWSGPAGLFAKSARELTSDGLNVLLGDRLTPVVVLAGVDEPPMSVLQVGMADDATARTNMAAAALPQLLVTRSRVGSLLREGTLSGVRQHFEDQLRPPVEAQKAAIEAYEIGG